MLYAGMVPVGSRVRTYHGEGIVTAKEFDRQTQIVWLTVLQDDGREYMAGYRGSVELLDWPEGWLDDSSSHLLTASQAAAQLGITRTQVYRLSRDHNIGTDVAGQRVFRPSDVDALRAIRAAHQPGRPRKATA